MELTQQYETTRQDTNTQETTMQAAKRFFSAFVRPGDIVEHPTDYSTDYDLIPLGPIQGWDCYAPNFSGNQHEIVGPFEAEVVERYNLKCIVVGEGYRKSEFFFGKADQPNPEGRPGHPCWHQSCCTLRFNKRFVPWTDEKEKRVVYYGQFHPLCELRAKLIPLGGVTDEIVPVASINAHGNKIAVRYQMPATLPAPQKDRELAYKLHKDMPGVTWAKPKGS